MASFFVTVAQWKAGFEQNPLPKGRGSCVLTSHIVVCSLHTEFAMFFFLKDVFGAKHNHLQGTDYQYFTFRVYQAELHETMFPV